MCDVSKMSFFRPWNIGASIEANETDKFEDPMRTGTTTTAGSIDRRVIEETSVKCESMSIEEDEDNVSVVSAISGATSETGSYHSHRTDIDAKLNRRQSISSSCSTNSCEDLPESRSLDMLSNLVYGKRTQVENVISNADGSIANSSSVSEASSCASRSSPQSAFTPTSYQYPIYPSLDYLNPLGLVSTENAAVAAAAAAANFEATYSAHHPHLFYGLPGMSLGPYGSSVEEAVKYIHQQDAAAKQMKKLRPKKFRCEHCDVAFSNNGQLKGHVRIHTGERPFKCDAEGCGKSFTRNEELTRHKRIHTGLRPHACLLCGKRFGRKDHLKKHTRTHDNRAAYHIPASALGPFALNHHSLPPGHPMSPYMYSV